MASPTLPYAVTAEDVAAAAERIRGAVHITPVLTSSAFDRAASTGAASPRHVYFKCELFQKSGSFKARGACNAVLSLSDEERARGVCTHSSGNHAQALAYAAARSGIPAHIVMPFNAPAVKRRAVEEYGGKVTTCEATQAAREATAARVAAETGATFIHPSEDPRVIAGQGTLVLELLRQVAESTPTAGDDGAPPLDAIIVPIGGGGMISGVAVAAKAAYPTIRIIAAEPAAADDAARSKEAGHIVAHPTPPDTMADGLKTTLGPHTWPVVRDLVERVVTVSEEEIAFAFRQVYDRLKVVIEPSAAVGVAALLSDAFKRLDGIHRVGVVLCGGNADFSLPLFAPPAKLA